MPAFRALEPGNVLLGLALALLSNAVFSTQDAIVKWLVADFAVLQVLFGRSVVIAIVAAAVYRQKAVVGMLKSKHKPELLLRAAAMVAAWLCYYSAARSLALADLVTLYYASPLIVTVLSIFILKEKVGWARWVAVFVGFAGVVVAANPTGRPDLMPAGLVMVAATLWAWAGILMRRIAATESTGVQMLFTSIAFIVACVPALPWIWVTPDLLSAGLMFGIGVAAALGQYLMYESVRHAPASAVAPCSYSSLGWAFLWGWVIWQDVPERTVIAGAALILLGAVIVVGSEWWNMRRRRSGGGNAV
ncbi:MAG: DMT family transporter [Alphaproteobacteria bacterium]|nr:DMT family transporter [Alphaproteobacteria bacterium]